MKEERPMNRGRVSECLKDPFAFLKSFVLLALITMIFAAFWYGFYAGVIQDPFFRKGNWLTVGVYALFFHLVMSLYGGYRIGHFKRGHVVYSAVLSAVLVNGFTYLQISLIGRLLVNPVPLAFMTAADAAVILAWACVCDKVYRRLFPPYKTLFIYEGQSSAAELARKIHSRKDKYEICSVISMERGLDAVFSEIERFEAVIICDIKSEARNKIIKYCFDRSKRAYLTPKISDMIIGGADCIHLFDSPLLLCRNQGLFWEQRVVKRAMDLLVSGTALILLSPVMLLIAALIRLYDHGPAFFRQQRLTLEGKVFEIYKFRSMIVDAEKRTGARLAAVNDSRITPVGKWIRRLRLDELPQLINILKGDMSLVGPRPERPEIAHKYEESMPEFSFRLKVKAGLTGYAQVLGKYNTTPYDKLKLDLKYVENYSVFLDVKLILMTLKILFIPESSEGVAQEEEQREPQEPDEMREHGDRGQSEERIL